MPSLTGQYFLHIPLRFLSNDYFHLWHCLAPLYQEPDPGSEVPVGATCHKEWQTLLTQFLQCLAGWLPDIQFSIWRNNFRCNSWNIFFQAMHISQDHKLAPYVNHRSSPSYFLPSGTCTSPWFWVTVAPTELPGQVIMAAPILQIAL